MLSLLSLDPETINFSAVRGWLREGVLLGLLVSLGVFSLILRYRRRTAQAEKRLRSMTALLPGMVYQYRLRPDGTAHFPYASDGIRAIYDLTPEQVREDAAPVLARIHPDDRKTVRDTIRQSAADLSPWRIEYRVCRADGTLRWMYGDGLPTRERDGAVLWHGFITDITARKAEQAALRESEARWQFALEGADQGIWDWYLPTGDMSYSEHFAAMLGYAKEELSSSMNGWVQRLHPEDQHRIFEALRDHAENRTPGVDTEFRVRCKDGSYKWLHVRGKALERDGQGHALSIVGTYIDITRGKQAEAALRETELRLRRIAAQIPGVVFQFRLSADGRMSLPYVNDAVEELFGVSPVEVRDDAREIFRYLLPEARDDVFASIRESARTLTTWVQEMPIAIPGVPLRWLLGESLPVKEDDGSIVWHGYTMDITERRAVEAALRESGARLRRIAARVPGVVFEFRLRADGGMAFPFASEGLRDLYGLAPEEVEQDALPALARVHPEDRDALLASLRESARTLAPWVHEHRVQAPGSAPRWVQSNGVPTREPDGSVLWQGFSSDVTTSKHAAQLLEREKAFVETLVQNLVTPTFVLAPDGTVRIWNRAMEELTGVPAREILGTRNHGRAFYGEDPGHHGRHHPRRGCRTASDTVCDVTPPGVRARRPVLGELVPLSESTAPVSGRRRRSRLPRGRRTGGRGRDHARHDGGEEHAA